MTDALFVGLQDDNKVLVFAIDGETGGLNRQGELPEPGGPSVFAISNDRNTLYVGKRDPASIVSYRIDRRTGALSPLGTAAQPQAPTFLAPDRSGKFMLCAYYQGKGAAVYRIGDDGAVGAPSQEWLGTDIGAHAIATDRSNRFAFVPHISRVQDNVLEPPKNIPGPNYIAQFRFDAQTGQLAQNSPHRVEQGDLVGPRHYCFHPTLDLVYFSNEQGSSVTSYRLDANGSLSPVQTISTLPADFTTRNTCSQIHLTPSGKYLYVGNRGHNSIAGFAVDAAGNLTAAGRAPTEVVPSAFSLDPQGRFLYAAGTASNALASYRIDQQTGTLTQFASQPVGKRPAAVMSVQLG